MDACHSPKEVVYYTRSEVRHNHQILVKMMDATEFRFTEGKMESELVGYSLPEQALHAISTKAFRKALSFVPELDKYLFKDSTGHSKFPNYGPKDGPPPVSDVAQRDLDIIQNLLAEFQTAIGELPE